MSMNKWFKVCSEKDQLVFFRCIEKLNDFKAMLDVLTPTAQFIIPVIVPYGGEMMDTFGFSVYPKKSIEYFEKFCRQILRVVFVKDNLWIISISMMFNQSKTYQSQRKEIKEGRTSDFINLMLNAQIDENEKISSTKGMTLDEMIAQVNISRIFRNPVNVF